MTVGAIVAAAGAGTRLGMGSKALVPLRGRSGLARAVALFDALDEVDRIVVVGPPDQIEVARREVRGVATVTPVEVCPGGASRQRSVHLGLGALGECDHVLVHDAARPLATPDLARRVLAAGCEFGAAFPGLAPRDAVKRVEQGRLVESLDRSRIVLAQTPQAFRYDLLLRAHFQAADAGLLGDDDAQLVAASGHPVVVIEGDPTNLKLTTPADLEVLEALLVSA